MNYKLLIDSLAKKDIIEIYNYVGLSDSSDKANRLLDNLERNCNNLERFPEREHIPEELRGTGIKRFLEIHYKPYRIIYEIIENIVYVHCVLDGRRNMQELLSSKLLR